MDEEPTGMRGMLDTSKYVRRLSMQACWHLGLELLYGACCEACGV